MENCIFCRIIRGEAPAYFIYRGRGVSVFLDIFPVEKGHMLIVPDEHYESLHDTPPRIAAKLFTVAAALVRILRNELGVPGVNVITNSGRPAGQEVFHIHVHVIPRWHGGGWRRLVSRHRLTDEEANEFIDMIKPYIHIIDEYLGEVFGEGT
ncbi:MAG: HIT domain-containing protein [Desulfurococcales archaeon]|nr:HIT domain-containing protein [Desulfurococcales archaeon]